MTLLDQAVGWRHGLVADVGDIPVTLADLPLANRVATLTPVTGDSSAGGVSSDPVAARCAAIAEAVERYVAVVCALPPASATSRLPFDAGGPTTDVYSVVDGSAWAAPVSLVTLDPARSTVSTSSGLAADGSPLRALLRAVQELVERDALMVTWLHGVAARQVPLAERLAGPVRARGGDAVCFDITPAYSPHPVAAVAGNLPQRGRPRLSLGLACRARWDDAVEKAYAEWAQGVIFAGMYRSRYPGLRLEPDEVTDFDRHAAYYTLHPERWADLPLWGGPVGERPPDAAVVGRPADELHHLATTLAANGVDTYYRDLTTVDAAAVGLRVVRALAPDLVPIHGDHRRPHLGGTAPDMARRYPQATSTVFPNPAPHPLG
ncbi:MAG TPA: YcaO-like family protein [Acidimicrobiales bacterium]|nr:YcaO-like family protein [Acidimicrobiales bacterium]